MPKAVKFEKYGAVGVLQVVEVPRPVPGPGQALVRVKAAGINPGEIAGSRGAFAQARWPAKFPSGQGSDFAGVVEEVGPTVESFRKGDEVIGFTNDRASQAEWVVVGAGDQLRTTRPTCRGRQAGALFVVGTAAAYAAVAAVALKAGETVVVSGAAGGVGSLVVQLAKIAGAKVIGLASEANHAWLKGHGVIPVTYGSGAANRIRAAAGGRIDAFIDTFGGTSSWRWRIGVAPAQINTIIDFAAAEKHKVKTAGSHEAERGAEVLAELAGLMAEGKLEIPIAATFPLDDVQDAYRRLEQGHLLGKIVLLV